MDSKLPKYFISHLEKQNVETAYQILTMTKAILVMVGDITSDVFKSFHPHPYYHTFCNHRKPSFESTVSRLKKEGFIKITIKNNEKIFILTKKGQEKREEALLQIKHGAVRREPWDKRWRLIIFDVPEKMKRQRDFLRRELYEFGCIQLQKSVWITPYRIDDDLRTIVNINNMAQFIKFAIIEKWDNDKELKKTFQLS